MAKILVSLVILVALVALQLSDAYPSRFNRHNLKPRSISDKDGPQGLEGPKNLKESLELGSDKDQIPKDLLNSPKELRGFRQGGFGSGGRPSEEDGFGEDGPKGIPKYGPRGGPESLPGPFGGPEGGGGLEGLNFGPEGPCMSKRCNPFRSRRPSYRSFLRELRRGRLAGPPGPFGPHGPGPMGPPLPVMTEIIIIRKVPIVLSKLIVAVLAHPEKFQKPGGEEKPGYEKPELEKPGYEKPGKEPVGPPEPQYAYGGSNNNEEVLLQDEPQKKKKEGFGESKVDYEGEEPQAARPNYKNEGPGPKDIKKEGPEPKDKDFEESMGEEVQLNGRSFGEGKDKKKGPEGKEEELKTLQSEKKEEAKLKYNEKEYLEKPEVGVPSKAELEASNELEPRGGGGNELDKDKDQLLNKTMPRY